MTSIAIDKLIRSARRTVGLEITREGQLIVRAPKRASFQEIEKFIRQKQQWILRHQENIRHKTPIKVAKQFISGEQFLFLGQAYPLAIVEQLPQALCFDYQQGFLLASRYLVKAEKIFLKWYQQQALHKFAERVNYYAAKEGLNYQIVRINNAKRQWGSCSRHGKLSFNWRLIMAPLIVIDYVVAHELAHLVHLNHSQRFWKKVESILPNYHQHRIWLRENEHLLSL